MIVFILKWMETFYDFLFVYITNIQNKLLSVHQSNVMRQGETAFYQNMWLSDELL